MLNSVPHTVHLIIDERTIKLTLSSADIKYLEKHVPMNQGVVILIISKSGAVYKKLVQEIGKSLAPKAFKETLFVTTLEEARQLLQEQYGVHYPQSAYPSLG